MSSKNKTYFTGDNNKFTREVGITNDGFNLKNNCQKRFRDRKTGLS